MVLHDNLEKNIYIADISDLRDMLISIQEDNNVKNIESYLFNRYEDGLNFMFQHIHTGIGLGLTIDASIEEYLDEIDTNSEQELGLREFVHSVSHVLVRDFLDTIDVENIYVDKVVYDRKNDIVLVHYIQY